MAVSASAARRVGGDISARNREDGGAVIEVRLPATGRTGAPEPILAIPPRKSVIEGSVLLVEDEEAVLEFERDVLAGAGAQVVTLMNLDEVKLRLLRDSFDAVIMDGKMPNGWNAPEIHRWIAQNRPGLEKHLMFTFSSVVEPEVRSFLHDNSVPYLVKPFEVGDLISQARRLLQKTIAATAGYVLLNTRAGLWLLSALATRPVWKQFDPLEVLYDWDGTSGQAARDQQGEEESLLSLVE